MNNLEFYNEDEAIHMDVKLFKEAGGGTIVENSCHGLRRDLLLMRNVSQSLDVNVIAGTGMFLADIIIIIIISKYYIYNIFQS